MLNYVGIVPHSPLLSLNSSTGSTMAQPVYNGFKNIAADLKARNIKKVLCIGAHPRVERDSFSCYVADKYIASFKEFGDLISKSEFKNWWELYDQIQSILGVEVIEPITEPSIDYAHGIPLFNLAKHFSDSYPISYLCLNDNEQATDEQRLMLGKKLRQAFLEIKEPCAVLCSGDLYITNDSALAAEANQANKDIKDNLHKQLMVPKVNFKKPAKIAPVCLAGPLTITKGIIGESAYQYQEYAFEQVSQTSFLLAGLKLD